ncbi:MAG: phosphopantothenoylcysteine decarboxylase [Gammaproteobacteria bacterium RIFCSPHIGHO2_12_FULL_37_34]|nr:MAG: phosphopantothenoylcysteine decarboxylase [Gammaproteobacteria bacterium RIFCSPHIGHO2_12_FULL_37_34]
MTPSLIHKHILLGVTGSIAAYKSADIVRRLREAGAIVRVIMTENAKRFITPLTMQAVSGHPIHEDLFDVRAEAAMGHIELARWADVIVVAPATADFMARLANGNANDLLTTLCLATRAPIALAPAMNQAMWQHVLTQDTLQVLKQKGIYFFEPDEGSQACGDVGPGRMMEPVEIVKKVSQLFVTGMLAGKKILITAGPTHEAIDPVRYMTNASSGKMGYALAQAAFEAGAEVSLISGPVHLAVLPHVTCFSVVSAQEMYAAVMKIVTHYDIFLAVAAVADYRCQHVLKQKLHKEEEQTQLQLERNPDIITAVGKLTKRPLIVGFAAETEDVIPRAKQKRKQKNMDLIVANCVGEGMGMNSDDNEVTVIGANFEKMLPRMSKQQLARALIEMIAKF